MKSCMSPAAERTAVNSPELSRPERRKRLPGFVNIGTSLLLAAFLVLTLVVLALLTISSAKSDYDCSQRLARQRSDYYAACSRAEELMAEADGIYRKAEASGEKPDYSALNISCDGEKLCWKTEVNGSQILSVEYLPESGKVNRWQLVPSDDWDSGETVSIYIP